DQRIRPRRAIHSFPTRRSSDLEITHDKLRNLTERAPVTGLLTGMELKIGENRNRGTRLGEITPDTGFNLLATVDEYYLGRVRERSEEHTSELQSRENLVCRLLL